MDRQAAMAFIFSLWVSFLSSGAHAAEKLPVFVSIVPQKYFVEKIGAKLVDVSVMVKPGASPATYEPKPRQMVAISRTRIYFSIGVPFEKAWLKKIAATHPGMRVVPTDHGINKIALAEHRHQDEGKHPEHGIPDPHIWLSPTLVMIQARTILKALQEVDPAHGTEYEINYKAFVSQLSDLDVELRNTFVGAQGLEFMVFHPSWGYFANTYGLKQVSIEIAGKDPKPAQLKELIEYAKKSGIKFIFVQPQYSAKSAQLIAREIGGQVIFADSLAEDWAGNLRAVARKLRSTLR
jgi:zinc transport system substrate-binding protein